MHLISRSPRPDDFAGCYRVCYATFGYDDQPGDNVARELSFLWANPSLISVVLEDVEHLPQVRIVGYIDAVFVTDAFVRWSASGMPPFVNVNVMRPLPDGTAAFLPTGAIGEAQACDGLNLLITHWGWAGDVPSLAEGLRIRERLSHEFQQVVRGYNLKDVAIEVIGEAQRQLASVSGFRLRTAYGGNPAAGPASLPDLRPFLMGVTRQEALAREGTWISPCFVYTPPRLCFTPSQRALLTWAVMGGTDAGFAAGQVPSVTTGAVKKRWDEIFSRVEERLPTLLPLSPSGRRGEEKRRHLLPYLREHPEELRPYRVRRDRGGIGCR